MEKQGFKQTEVGLIPNDWIVLPQKDAVKYINGRAYSINEWESSGIPVVRLQNLTQRGGRFYYSNLNLPEYQYMYKGDLIFMWSASFGPYIWWGDKAIFHYHIWKIECNNKITDKQFYYHKLVQLTEELKKGTSGSTMLHLTKDGMEKYLFALPPSLEEQKAIATALSDVDELIANLDKLITKKKAIKQGAMQQLLTPPHKGGKRLKGFTGDWEEKRLGEIAEIYQPITISQEKFSKDGYPVYGANGVVGSYIKYNHKLWQTVITCRGSTCGTVNRTVNESWITGNAMVMNVDNQSSLNKEFFYHLLFNCNFISCITGSGQPQIVRQPLFDFIVSYPENLSEQIAIATMLSDMDLEIEQLESKKAKYQSVKQGMMQELLTGKTRLI
ncbi:hypothetical protein GENT5_13990 [Flavobacterium ammoniigenes]|uniref:Type I restriction modification DNA specificity domain-containing protein n=1 Tax=Flavobacterium ammoniigenes TaxID=1751095 RepID=A0ABM7V6B1_9FLAO|nr:restriction endonuclease subunit S [Flavobacterium ammoniigenes]BDB55094.1 hypothetical protein GENT5_13990 [Flavobacterium ammoniigenes]